MNKAKLLKYLDKNETATPIQTTRSNMANFNKKIVDKITDKNSMLQLKVMSSPKGRN